MGVTNELGVPLSPEAMNILQSHIDKNFSRNVSINLVIKFYFFLNLTFVILRSTLLIASGIAMGFGALVG